MLTDRNKHRLHGDKIAAEIINYFGKLPKKYFQAVFYKCLGEHSVWSCLCSIYEQVVDVAFTAFVEEVFKCHFDQLRLKEDQLRLKEEQ